ncbi:RagB/SusD family nutrient uptake outer membrane protein [Arenibacter aquaticus]|uniref:RagB/SusD family nutrient uptake outer membrane protein n=1 Tax=Arenibacter aquaticus TaxID=2489054 RepID=A0A430JZY8_9FLAO|nr:RagB/SusD family nutrient uptake outer membrane protein [Arenibacter aquaticus]RTE52373.1 RagB/SusD family nutrient uptake outer membrane protein [Arenibacter aquaticus]
MRYNKYLLVFFFISIFTSCEKEFLDIVPDNLATIDLAFTNQYNAEKYLYTCYSYLPSPSAINENPALNAGDEIWYPETERNNNGPTVAQGFQNITTPRFDFWRGNNGGKALYVGIRNCNIFLDNVDNVPGLDKFIKEKWKAEVNFLKAYYHFYLLRMYGPIVINDEALSVSASTDEVKVDKNTVEEAFEYVISLLDKAISGLPETLQFEDEEMGRVTKPIAAAIKARVLMTYASPLFNGNTVYSSIKNSEGKSMFPSSYDASKWERAAKACKEAIDMAEGVGAALYQKADYVDPFPQNDTTLLKAALRGRVTERWNKEILWGHTENTSGIQYNSMPRLYGYTSNPVASRHSPPLRIAEMYYSENGVPIDEDVNFDYNNRYKIKEASSADRFHVEQGQKTAVLNFDRETRFYADLSFDRGVWFGNGRDLDTDPWYIHSRKGEFASVFEISQYSVTGYWPKKLINIKTTVKNGTSLSTNRYAFPIIRLADLYLYYSEALNEMKSAPDNEVYQYIDLVRERAGLDGVVESWSNYSKDPNKPTTKEGMREIIQQERLIEMAFEGGRFWDLRRWKLSEIYMNKPIKGWSVLEQDVEDYYNVRVLYNPSFSQKDYLWPIAEGELVNNPNLQQNPGW